jgi:hypothetical protein
LPKVTLGKARPVAAAAPVVLMKVRRLVGLGSVSFMALRVEGGSLVEGN